MTEVRIAIVGLGNCASSLVQGLEYYKDADPNESVPGLMHVELGGYHIHDVRIVAAFDVDAKKVGTDVADAIFTEPNNTIRFSDVPPTGVTVQRGHTLDGLGTYYRDMITESELEPVDVAQVLRDTRADVLISYLPVGSEHADKHYAQCAIDAGVAFVNALPVFIASDPVWAKKFADAGVPIVGDDIKSQVGATITHRVLAKLFEDRGVELDRTYQLNFGGNMDFMNMLERERLTSKKISKTQSVQSQLDQPLPKESIHIGPSDHVPWLEDRKWAMIRLEGRNFGDVPLTIEMKLEVWDSPNSAGVIIDAAPLREAREGSRDRRPDHRPERLLHEEPAGAVHRRRSATDGRGVRERGHPARGRRPRSARQHPSVAPGPPGAEATGRARMLPGHERAFPTRHAHACPVGAAVARFPQAPVDPVERTGRRRHLPGGARGLGRLQPRSTEHGEGSARRERGHDLAVHAARAVRRRLHRPVAAAEDPRDRAAAEDRVRAARAVRPARVAGQDLLLLRRARRAVDQPVPAGGGLGGRAPARARG